jgi:plasmid segregation protein ParM
MKVIGYEAANSFVKIKSDKGEEAYLNTLRERSEVEELVYADGTFGKSNSDKSRYKVEGRTFTRGDIYEAQSSSSRDSDRYGSEAYKLESLIAIAGHVDNGDEVKLVTGLPVKDYHSKAEDMLAESLLGTHTVFVDKEPKTFTIEEVRNVLQPLGTLTFLMLNEDGSPKDGGIKLAKQRKVVVDIGFGTTDIAILEGTTLVDSFGVDVAMLDMYERILKKLKLQNDMTPFQIEQALRAGTLLHHGGREFDAAAAYEEARKVTASTIVSRVKNRISLDKYDASIFTGGGVTALRGELKHLLEDVPNAVPVREPQLANARGYFIYGKHKK